jgi:hypothetical protein
LKGGKQMAIKMDEDEQAGFALLCEVLPADLATDIVKHRRRKKAHLTARVARALVREYKAYGDPEKAAEIHLTRAWIGFECEWIKKAGKFTDQHHPTPRQSANYGNTEPVSAPLPKSPEEMERRSRIAAQARELIRGATQRSPA